MQVECEISSLHGFAICLAHRKCYLIISHVLFFINRLPTDHVFMGVCFAEAALEPPPGCVVQEGSSGAVLAFQPFVLESSTIFRTVNSQVTIGYSSKLTGTALKRGHSR